MKGVDISKHQPSLTIADIKKAGFDFAILRGGYTGYGAARTKNKDYCFDRWYRQAKKIGFPVGVYYYSCAKTMDEGRAEAEFLFENCLKGNQFEFPIYIDIEDERWQTKDKKGVTDAIIGFCEYLEDRKFFVGIYTSTWWLNNRLEAVRLEPYSKWIAAWRKTKPSVQWNGFHLWQNSDNGRVGNVRVDTDEAYLDFPAVIKRAGLNGYV